MFEIWKNTFTLITIDTLMHCFQQTMFRLRNLVGFSMTHMRKANTNATTVLAIIILFPSTVAISCFLQYLVDDNAYGDGLSQESLPPSPIGNRELSLFVKISPSILTTENAKILICSLDYLMRQTIGLFSTSHTK